MFSTLPRADRNATAHHWSQWNVTAPQNLSACRSSRARDCAILNNTVLLPHTLTSGRESGLCNQLIALAGYAMLMVSARSTRNFTALILPNFTSHDRGGTDSPFTDLFEADPFIQSLATIGIVVRKSPLPGEHVSRPRAMTGWWAYKRRARAYPSPWQHIEDAVYRGLTPAAGIRARV